MLADAARSMLLVCSLECVISWRGGALNPCSSGPLCFQLHGI